MIGFYLGYALKFKLFLIKAKKCIDKDKNTQINV